MTLRTTAWPAGTPCWVELMTSDIDAARRFYEPLFGWELSAGDPATGGYVMAEIDGNAVAGLSPQQPEQAGHPSVWNTYLASDDVDATVEQITAAGGSIFAPPFDVTDRGRMAVAQDPTGGAFAIWQAKEQFGAAIANETNTLSWNELLTRDYQAAQDFYAAVFGYTYTDLSGDGFSYCTFEVDGNTAGGLGSLPSDAPAEVPAHWRTYFAVADTDATVDSVLALGGSVLLPAKDTPYGRNAYVADPQGAMFAVIKPAVPG
jgi:uncharacterized protein